ncbi:hypothetical protein KCP70_12275 [Salmonella enterica subsp. enterica]|nr:hypothetical protein KCP70_12275 [Salmonella enterica subsp. enterica]
MMRLLEAATNEVYTVGFARLLITLPVICYLVWLFVKLQRCRGDEMAARPTPPSWREAGTPYPPETPSEGSEHLNSK